MGNLPPADPITLRLCGRTDEESLRGWLRAHLEVLATWNPAVDVESRFDQQWFERPGVLFPWAIEVDRTAAGFALMGNQRLAQAMGAATDFYLYEFHVGAACRRRGVGRRAVDLLLVHHRGSWTVDVMPANRPAIEFWRHVLEPRGVRLSPWTSDEGVQFVRLSTQG